MAPTPSAPARRIPELPIALALTAMATFSALLVVGRPVAPQRVPLPKIDRVAAHAERERERSALAAGSLPYAVRAVGEAYRRTMPLRGTVGGSAKTRLESARLGRLVRRALKTQGAGSLWRLRTLQAELFVHAVRSWRGGPVPPQLLELSGPFAARAQSEGWLEEGSFWGSDSDLRALFRVHWNRATGLSEEPGLRITANQWRQYFHFVLRGQTPRDPKALRQRLGSLAVLRSHAPDYPLDLARGVLLFQVGAFEAAAEALAQHRRAGLGWSLRVRNYLAACGQQLR